MIKFSKSSENLGPDFSLCRYFLYSLKLFRRFAAPLIWQFSMIRWRRIAIKRACTPAFKNKIKNAKDESSLLQTEPCLHKSESSESRIININLLRAASLLHFVVGKKLWNDNYLFEVELLQHFLQFRKLSRAARECSPMLCTPAVDDISWNLTYLTLAYHRR